MQTRALWSAQWECRRLSEKLEELGGSSAEATEKAAAAEGARSAAEEQLKAAQGKLKELESKLAAGKSAMQKVRPHLDPSPSLHQWEWLLLS